MRRRFLPHALDAAAKLGLVNHTLYIDGHRKRRTCIRLDQPTWSALVEIAGREQITVHEFCTAIDVVKPPAVSLTVAIRLGVLRYYRDAATESGHSQAGHGKAIH